MSEAKQSDSTDLLGQFLEAAKRDGVTRLIPTHPDDIRAALDAKDAEIERLQAELLALQKDRDVWVRRADKTWHEAHAVATERERCAGIARRHSTCKNDNADVIACAIESGPN
jgi:hypothetical protein